MISIFEAQRIVLQNAKLFPFETVDLENASGRVLREDIKNDRDQPPFDKSLMDGIALRFGSWQKGTRAFTIDAVIPAGVLPKPLKTENSCVRIMTGAPIPAGADCVVPIEQITLEDDVARLKDWTILYAKENIRFKGRDGKKGDMLLKSGSFLAAPHIGIAASVGKSKLKVTKIPKIAIVSTGDELVAINKPLKPYQTRVSNSYALSALLKLAVGAQTKMFHLKDNPVSLAREIRKILSDFDTVIISGGVSMGEFDYVPQALKDAGVKMLFHKVAQKPGKPIWFGVSKGKAVFALPGNPVSTQICAYRYVLPFLYKSLGLNKDIQHAVLAEDFKSKTDLTYFLPVKIEEKQGTRYAFPVEISGSGDFAALAVADGFVELSGELREFPKGHRTLFFPWA